MVKIKNGALGIEESGTRRYICVPVAHARDLHDYLRSNKVCSSPPEPSFTGFDNIELARDVDLNRVQKLLNDWH